MEIEEGDQVVTPEGRLGKVDSMIRDGKSVRVEVNKVGFQDDLIEDLVKISEPIRARVSRQCYAESLVALAEEMGFKTLNTGECEVPIEIRMIKFWPKGTYLQKGIGGPPGFGHKDDLTYRDDLPQIEAWLEYHSESEDDECDTCGGNEFIHRGDGPEDCPNCTDDDSYSEPRPEDEEWRKMLAHVVAGQIFDSCNLGLKTDNHLETDQRAFQVLLNYIDDLESELQDVREEQDEVREDRGNWRQEAKKWRDKWCEAQERIEEARQRIKQTWNHKTNKLLNDLLEILTSDSDEGDEV